MLLLVAGWPLVKIVLLALQKQDTSKYALFHNGGTTSFVGLRNFTDALTSSEFWTVLRRTVAVHRGQRRAQPRASASRIALLLNRVSRWARILLTAVLLFVWAVPSTVSTQIYAWLFNNQYGVVNYLLDKLPGVHMHGHDWFADPTQGWPSSPSSWCGARSRCSRSRCTPASPRSRRTCSRPRAATAPARGRRCRLVLLPFLRPLLVILTTLSIIWDFGVFNQIWFMRNGHPEPGYQTIGIYMYSTGVGSSRYNTARPRRPDDPRAAAGDGGLHPPAVPDRGRRMTAVSEKPVARTAGAELDRRRSGAAAQPPPQPRRPPAGTRWRSCWPSCSASRSSGCSSPR